MGRNYFKLYYLLVFLLGIAVMAGAGPAAAKPRLSKGQTVYVPVYSHVYYGDQARTLNLTVTLIIRNTGTNKAILVNSVKYLNSSGKLLREYVPQPVQLAPLNSTLFHVKESDVTGGAGASFIVKWHAKEKVNAPIIEAIMIGAMANQGISFTERGQVIEEKED